MTQPKPFRHGVDIQFRWIRRWWFIFPYKVLQFREKFMWQEVVDGLFPRNHEDWSDWYDVYQENENGP